MQHLLDRTLELDIIGAVLLDEEARWELFSNLTADDFGDPQHARLWDILHDLAVKGAKINYNEVVKLAGPELFSTVSKAYETYLSSENLPHKIERLRTLAQARRYTKATKRLLSELKKTDDPGRVLNEHLQELSRILAPAAVKRILGPEDWPRLAYEEASKRCEIVQAGGMPYLDIGFPTMSRKAAIQPQNLVFVAAKTKSKKTMLMLNIASYLAIEKQIPVLYLNTEMSIAELTMRVASMVTSARNYDLRTGQNPREVEKLRQWLESNSHNKLYLSDSLHNLTSADVVAMTRKYKHTHGIQVLVVDYIQRLKDREFHDGDDWQLLLDATARLKSLAQELDIVVFAVAQLTDSGHLQRGRYMLNEVDILMTLYPGKNSFEYELNINNARHVEDQTGQTLHWDPETLRFQEVYQWTG